MPVAALSVRSDLPLRVSLLARVKVCGTERACHALQTASAWHRNSEGSTALTLGAQSKGRHAMLPSGDWGLLNTTFGGSLKIELTVLKLFLPI